MEKFGTIIGAILALLTSFLVGVVFAPLVIRLAKRLHAGQPILSYVEQHAAKAGTPTFGGFIFLVPSLLTVIAFSVDRGLSVGLIAAFVTVSFSVLGFLDDFIKIRTKDNMGLRPYQKIVGQVAIALIVSFYAFRRIGSSVFLPFYGKEVDFGVFYVPFAAFVYLALSNCVNLTDGIDGLASNTSLVYLFTFGVVQIICLFTSEAEPTLIFFTFALIGGVAAFLLFNTNRASIFMGDTGSLALGGASAAIALFTKQPFLILFVGITYVVSGISIVLQVAYFKWTRGKRIFLMAPFHHHLEKKGLGEAKICNLYFTITLMMGALAILSVVVGLYAL